MTVRSNHSIVPGALTATVLALTTALTTTACTTGPTRGTTTGGATTGGTVPVVAAPTAGALAGLTPGPATAARGVPAPDPAQAAELLAELAVRVEDTGAHYDRDQWGDWATHDGCSTREEILIRDGRHVAVREGCAVTAGRWVSPYDGRRHTDPGGLEIDHRVAPAEAARSGARGWSRAQRRAFYNDPGNLAAITAALNSSKGDDDPARWQPPLGEARCGWAVAYITTKHTYRLHVDPAEHAALAAALRGCPIHTSHPTQEESR